MRTLVDIPEQAVRRLDARARSEGVSRAALIREAIDRWLGPEEVLSINDVFGLWADYDIDGLEFQRELRAERDEPDKSV